MPLGTFYPDANPESTSVDGIVGYSIGDTTTWASIHDKTDGDASTTVDSGTTGIVMIRRDASNNWVDMRRGILLFDTSSITNNFTVQSGTFSIMPNTINNNDFTDSMTLCASTPASNTSLVVGDYDQYGATKFATDVTVASMGAGTYSNWGLNDSGIAAVNVSGVTKFALLCTNDFANTTPGGTGDGRTQVTFRLADYTGATSDPMLIINYSSGGGLDLTSKIW